MALAVFHSEADLQRYGSVSLEEARCYIDALDLTYIAESMCAPHYPLPRWTHADAVQCCQLYKNFLFLLKKYLPMPLVPTREIDEFWHNHILYTRNYFHDCEKIFGHYLHHEPASPTDDGQALISNFLETKKLYLEEFGQPLVLTRT
ncbi:hypothetical protein AQUSIP_18360 [Aquicella siphonis]|uniref:Glycine-rich domain-containing protein-like n=1 Tax=Aquicella siphonis TaxID=254247 RepID=A0A5E4PJJ8_9COXI|nr:hypothetical protein [Aquicella siphonis]VVC76521.1 hypothetical protein AQUSIP_18360 [Aquicella siphonis]